MQRRKLPPLRYTELFLRSVPVHLKDKFKAACARRGLTMNKVILRMMKEYVRQDESPLRDDDLRRITMIQKKFKRPKE